MCCIFNENRFCHVYCLDLAQLDRYLIVFKYNANIEITVA